MDYTRYRQLLMSADIAACRLVAPEDAVFGFVF
jgi:hypothetical protein